MRNHFAHVPHQASALGEVGAATCSAVMDPAIYGDRKREADFVAASVVWRSIVGEQTRPSVTQEERLKEPIPMPTMIIVVAIRSA